MKLRATRLVPLMFCALSFTHAQIAHFDHIIVVFQENRTPDNLFQGLCAPPYGTSGSCSTRPTGAQYNIQTDNWLDNTSSTGKTTPSTVALANAYDLYHIHSAFTAQCDLNTTTGKCRMDGAAGVKCTGTCPSKPQFKYVSNTDGSLNPYLSIATQYGWANYMFQTNQGPSYPAHQYIFGGTAAPSAEDDANGIFAMDNVHQSEPGNAVTGCTAYADGYVTLITPTSQNQNIYPCFEHQTLSDLLDSAGVSWKYYTPSATSLWTAPNSIQHICMPSAPTAGTCTGDEWVNNVHIGPGRVLTDIANCSLTGVSWVIPDGKDSDHAQSNQGEGPSWVASIVNAVGNNPQCKSGELYWNNTAIVITWDDWGGWYDHEAPKILAGVQGDYQYGFRVPLIIVSAYTTPAYVNNNRLDFGSILRFIEHNFSITEGALNFADARIQTDLRLFFNLKQAPRPFQTIAAPLDANYFINDKRPPTDPDTD